MGFGLHTFERMQDWEYNRVIGSNRGKAILVDQFIQASLAPMLIICHGFKSFKNWGSYDRIAEFFVNEGFSLIKFNFSHNGGTASEPVDFPDLDSFAKNTYALELADLQIVLDYQEDALSLNTSAIALLGHSRGGAMAAITAIEDPRVDALITWNAVAYPVGRLTSYDIDSWRSKGVLHIANGRTGQNMPLNYSLYEDAIENAKRYNILGRAQEFKGEWLIIHAQDDEIVAMPDANALHKAFLKSHLSLISSGGHTLGQRHPEELTSALPLPLQEALTLSSKFLKGLGLKWG